jgi:hypothetical protein
MTEYRFGNMADWHSDLAREHDGVPFDIERDALVAREARRMLIVRRAGTRNRAFMALSPRMHEHAQKMVRGDDDPSGDEIVTRHLAMAHVCAHSLVLGWRNIRDEQGAEIPFSADACEALLRFCPDVVEGVMNFALSRAHFHAEETAQEIDTAKKSYGGTHAAAPS